MPSNTRRLEDLLRRQCDNFSERIPSYHVALADAVKKILSAEERHQGQQTDIKKEVAKLVRELAQRLAAQGFQP